jgi:hypothetical protein
VRYSLFTLYLLIRSFFMTNFAVRFADGVIGATITAPFVALGDALIGGALIGYIYGKLADLPADQVAKAWAIWNVAEVALTTLSATFTENKTAQALIRATILTLTTAIGIQELQKRGLVGENMVILLIAIRALGILGILARAAFGSSSNININTDQDVTQMNHPVQI